MAQGLKSRFCLALKFLDDSFPGCLESQSGNTEVGLMSAPCRAHLSFQSSQPGLEAEWHGGWEQGVTSHLGSVQTLPLLPLSL